MNEIITDEKLNMIKDNRSASIMIDGEWVSIGQIVTALLAERAERAKNPGVWDGAPEDATKCRIEYYSPNYAKYTKGSEYTRELPKTRVREFAEARAKTEISIPDTDVQLDVNELADVIESAIIKYEESIK